MDSSRSALKYGLVHSVSFNLVKIQLLEERVAFIHEFLKVLPGI